MADTASNEQTAPNANNAASNPPPAEDTEAYIEAYHAIAEWIRFADAKAGVVLAVAAALAGLLVPTVKPIIEETGVNHMFPHWKIAALALFGLFILFLLLSGLFAFRCISPFRLRGRHPSLGHCNHFHPAAVSDYYGIDEVKKFTDDCNQGGIDMFRNEVIAAILMDSHISSVKYRNATRSIRLFTVSALFAFAYLVVIQL